jgi:hypothetical protein
MGVVLWGEGITMSDDKFPPLPRIPMFIPENKPGKVIAITNDGYLATKNFFSTTPTFRKYKRLGWALRYLGVTRKEFWEKVLR